MALLFASVFFLVCCCRTLVLIPNYFAIKIQVNSIFISKSLCMSNFCCNFAAQNHYDTEY